MNKESKKLTPSVRACAMANQATHNAITPTNQRRPRGSLGQPETPPRISHAPPTTQAAADANQSPGKGRSTAPSPHNARHSAPHTAPVANAAAPVTPFKRAHSQPAAAIIATDSAMKGTGEAAKSAGSRMASSTRAVMTR